MAETCRFKIDLRSGFVEALCSLAVSIPHHETDDGAASNGRLVLARAEASVRFIRPRGGGTTSSMAVQSATPYHAPDSVPLRKNAAASLACDMDNPLFHHDEHRDDDAVYAQRARRLAESELLSIVASDQIDRLCGEARAKTTGFRSALRQLDRVTNVSSC